jgi:hypothetical protein
MSATIFSMDYRMIDTLNANQLEIGDLIDVDEEIVRIVDIISLKDGYALTYENEFGEKDLVEISDDDTFNLYILD